jgi:hypothetical protein
MHMDVPMLGSVSSYSKSKSSCEILAILVGAPAAKRVPIDLKLLFHKREEVKTEAIL